jgi:serine phosphatase RsbU (regulator of sigma subunit)
MPAGVTVEEDWMAAAVERSPGTKRGIGFKLTLAVVALIVAALASSTVLSTNIIGGTMDKNLRERMEEATRAVKAAFDVRLLEVGIFTDAFSNDPELQRKISADPEAIKEHVRDLAKRAKLDVVIVHGLDLEGGGAMQLIGGVTPSKIKPEIFAKTRTWVQASKDQKLITQAVAVEGRLFLLSVAPVSYYGRVTGYLTCGREFTTAAAKDIREKMGAEVGLIVGTGLQANTVQIDASTVARLIGAFGKEQAGRKVVETFGEGDGAHFVMGVPLQNVGVATSEATLVVAQSQRAIVEARKKTLQNFLTISIILAAVGAAIGLLLARRISTPIVAMEKKFRQILDSGDLALRVPEGYKDEVGQMAKTFNVMQTRVQELHHKLAESERRMRQELEMAAVVQEMLFPALPPESPAIDLSSFVATSSETGGDWYGFVVNPKAKTTTVIVGDVTGHGVPAALVTAIIHGFFRAVEAISLGASHDWIESMKLPPQQKAELSKHIAEGLPLMALLSILNRILIDSTKGSLFVTLFVSTLNHETRILEYVNAAHNLPFVLRTSGGRPEVGVLPSAPSNRLGDQADLRLSPRRVQLSKGDTVVWYTDGLIECESEAGEEYGQKRLTRLIARCAGMEATQMKDRIVEESYKFFGNRQRKDDITLVVGKVK